MLRILQKDLEEGRLIDLKSFNKEEQIMIKSFQLLSSKPTFFIANINESDASKKNIEELNKVER